MAQVISANRLRDGLIVFRNGSGGWVENFGHAAVFEDVAAAKAAHEAALADVKACIVVEVAPIAVTRVAGADAGNWRAEHIRDDIRINGPTITPGQTLASAAHAASGVASGKVTLQTNNSGREFTDVSI